MHCPVGFSRPRSKSTAGGLLVVARGLALTPVLLVEAALRKIWPLDVPPTPSAAWTDATDLP